MTELLPRPTYRRPQGDERAGSAGVQWRFAAPAIDRQRILSGMTREALAHAARVDPKTVRDALNGRRRPTLGTVRQLADAVGLTLADVLLFEAPVPAPLPPTTASPAAGPPEQLSLVG